MGEYHEIIEEDEILIPSSASSLDFLRAVYADASQPMHRRMRAAIAALPFESPKLAVTATVNTDGFAARLEAMIERSRRATELRALPSQAIEGRAINNPVVDTSLASRGTNHNGLG